ncbi:hypothetical protein GQ457_16G009210 [Hibiscus cannabinus]
MGFSKFIEVCSILKAELRGIYGGLSLVCELGYRRLEVESDSLDAIQLANCLRMKLNDPTIVSYIHELCRQQWEVRFFRIQCDDNSVADRLAKLAHMHYFCPTSSKSPTIAA